ncbi:MAG TPA: DJ-1/PfpI family protein [Candidatus Limnocylindrales bacterium]|nr:DJ-1/PfpI family protein [Candidatus Limnocylindrales bacterium]
MGERKDRLIAFVLYPGASPLELVGPLTVLRDLRIGTRYRSVVVAEQLEPMQSDTSLRLVAARTFEEVQRPFALFVPGGAGAELAARDAALLAYVRTAGATAQIVGSTGNGAVILAAAGLLTGRRVATHWAYRDVIESAGATYVAERWVEDGPLLTAAGSAAGIDAMLHLTAKLRSESAARLAQLWMEYDPQPPFGRPDPKDRDASLAATLRSRPAFTVGQQGGSPDVSA